MRVPRAVACLLSVLLVALPGSAGPGGAQEQQESQEIVVAMIPEKNIFQQAKRFRPLQDYLSASTGVEYRFTVMSTYHDAFWSLSNGKAQAAILGSTAAFLAQEQRRGELVARPLWKDGTSTYRALIIARKDAGISRITDFKGKRYAFVNPLASAGWIFDRWMLRKAGVISPESFFGDTFVAGSHDVVIEAILRGEADGGGCKDLVWKEMVEQEPELAEKVAVIATSLDFPDSNLVFANSMPFSVKSALRDKIFSMHAKPDGRKVLADMGMTRFIPTGRGDFDYLRKLFRELRINPESYAVPAPATP